MKKEKINNENILDFIIFDKYVHPLRNLVNKFMVDVINVINR